jgi:phage terminase large subunit-like protein
VAGVPFPTFAAHVGLELEPFQVKIAAAIGGRQREVLVLLPRGNGKTTLLGALAVWHLVSTADAMVYCAAASREQARILGHASAQFARALNHPRLIVRHDEIRYCPTGKATEWTRLLKVVASDAPKLHGLTPSLAIVDELHAHPKGDVHEAFQTALIKRPGAKLIGISSAGAGADSPLGRLRSRALALPKVVRRRALTDARGRDLRMLEWSLLEDEDPDDLGLVKAANPASWITRRSLRAAREAVPDVSFRRYHCNQWGVGEGMWLPPGAWQRCVGEPRFEDGERIVIGVDVGGSRSSTAVVWISERRKVGCRIFHGETGIDEAADLVLDLAERYQVIEATWDPWRYHGKVEELADRVLVSKFPQTPERMIRAAARLHRAIVHGELELPDDEELAQHSSNAIAKHSRRGWTIESPSASRHVPVDGVVALAMAHDRLESADEGALQVVGWL